MYDIFRSERSLTGEEQETVKKAPKIAYYYFFLSVASCVATFPDFTGESGNVDNLLTRMNSVDRGHISTR